ncbi:hypothetical protein JL193_05185 [Polaribacter batillariae]|uniref:CBM2 domain-containing protein n=1 Tax=Polaribacter batillariae TaxID=2808900 RepID=A0ABX7T0R1_9FLAO|nr:hypothetical protein [Polaribacter batillariae]QTD38668.1 hypothetical protein JL193_05185 [Polaribacter batillariae]
MAGLANIESEMKLGGGAQFWVYLSPQNNTVDVVKGWQVKFSQGNWSDSITSENPTKQIKTPNLSGNFTIELTALNHSTNPPTRVNIPAQAGSENVIGCNSNCASFVGIVANEKPLLGGVNAQFWTTWDAICSRG